MKHKKTASSFVKNIQRAMRVSGGDSDFPGKMTQSELSKSAGVARSTLALHRELEADKSASPNPTLEKICNIADALNVPPAFLLMRPEDWTRLAQAINYYAQISASNRLPPLFSKISTNSGFLPLDQAEMAFQLAIALGIDGRVSDSTLDGASVEFREDINSSARSRRLSIYATSALPPISYMKERERLAAFVVSVIFGAHHKSDGS